MRDITVAITEASYSGNKGAAAMLQSSIQQLHDRYGEALNVNLMSVYPADDRKQVPFDFVKVVPAKPNRFFSWHSRVRFSTRFSGGFRRYGSCF